MTLHKKTKYYIMMTPQKWGKVVQSASKWLKILTKTVKGDKKDVFGRVQT